jgi:hypothetical protein
MARPPLLTRATLRRWLDDAMRGEQSAVIAEATLLLGTLTAVYALLDQDRSKEVS